MISNPSLKPLTIRKCDRKAYSVSGAPVVTLGVVDLEFKLNGHSYTHQFIILRGLIHPVLLGLDFLKKYQANISFEQHPSLSLRHPVDGRITIKFISLARKVKQPPYVSLLGDVELPPHSISYVDAYMANVDEIGNASVDKSQRIIGIAAIQKEETSFDPGFIMRNGVIDANMAKFKIELMNPFDTKIKVNADTPVGAIFDDDCEVMDTGQTENNLWEGPPEDANEAFLRQQALFLASIDVVEENGSPVKPHPTATDPDGPKDPLKWPQPRPPPETKATDAPPFAGSKAKAGLGPCKDPDVPLTRQSQPSDSEQKENQPLPPKSHFTPAFTDSENGVKFAHKLRPGEEINKDNKDFIISFEGCDAINEEQKKQLEEAILECPGPFATGPHDVGCTSLVYHQDK